MEVERLRARAMSFIVIVSKEKPGLFQFIIQFKTLAVTFSECTKLQSNCKTKEAGQLFYSSGNVPDNDCTKKDNSLFDISNNST